MELTREIRNKLKTLATHAPTDHSQQGTLRFGFRFQVRGVYPKGVGRAISHISKSGGWRIGPFELHIFDRLLLH